jgi:four helix bundle protein
MSRLTEELRQRCKAYASAIIRLYVRLPKEREEIRVVGKQMLRSGTSVAAHSREASRARSDAEFIAKIESLAQEADETALWLELLIEDCEIINPLAETLVGESRELLAIFSAIAKKVKER